MEAKIRETLGNPEDTKTVEWVSSDKTQTGGTEQAEEAYAYFYYLKAAIYKFNKNSIHQHSLRNLQTYKHTRKN